jgi:general secretion pathway protein D
MVLQLNNAVLVKSGNSYQIQLATTAIPSSSSPKLSGSSLSPGFQIRIIPLSFVGAKQMVDILKPLLAPTALLKTDVVRNLIMVTGTSEQLENIEETVNIFDVDTLQGLSFGLFHLNYVDPETINKELSEIFGSSEGGPLEEMFKILPIERLNAILVITPQPKYIEQLKTWLTRLDRSKTGVSGSVHVYRVQHIKAVELATTLNDIFNQTGTMSRSKSASLAPGSKSTTLSNKTDTATTSNTPSSNSSLSNTNKRGNITGIGEVRITADEVNNTLITVATTPDYKIVREVITELDVMPLQVHIDASILSVNLDDSIKYGVKWTFDNIPNGEYSGIADLALSTPTSGFSYLISKSSNVKASIDALAERKNISVISSPSLMVLNNQEARIQVGDKVPIRTSQSTNTNSGSANPIQTSSIEMLETGVTLKVTPRVNSGGVVIMDIEQSVDTPSKTQTSSIDSPSVLKRSINSSVVVDSEETVVLGGLISDNIEDSKSGIPLLMDLPWVGDLFSSTSRQKTRNELIVLITPRVVQNQTDARAVTRDYKKQLTGIYNVLPKLKDK